MQENGIIEQATNALDAILDKIKMKTGDTIIRVPMRKNVWMPLPSAAASSGVMQSLVSDKGDKIRVLVYMPAYTEIREHFHDNQEEELFIISGTLHYKLYKSEEFTEVLKEGELNSGDKLIIHKGKSHYLFTAKDESYIMVDFIKT